MKKPLLFTLLCALFLFALPLAAQDAEDAAADPGAAPEIIALSPDTLIIPGGGRGTVEVEYEDADGDANRFIWEVFEAAEGTTWNLPDGAFNQEVAGTTIPVTFRCDNTNAAVSIQLIVEDAAGNQSEPAFLLLECQTTAEDPGQGGSEIVGSAPEIVSITPDRLAVVGAGTATTVVEYEDAEGDATRFLWRIAEADDESVWTLEDGFFSQEAVGTSIPVTFRCAADDVTRTVEMELIVEDAAGNQSEPETVTLICVTEG